MMSYAQAHLPLEERVTVRLLSPLARDPDDVSEKSQAIRNERVHLSPLMPPLRSEHALSGS
jgi:hypothetical protein